MTTTLADKTSNMKKNVLKNVFSLIEKQNLKIGEVEEKIGVSAGYLSRLNKDDNTTKISLELVNSLSEVLGTSIDMLCKYDLFGMTPNEVRIIQFVEKLTQETLSNNRKWNRETKNDINAIEIYGNGYTSHPLFRAPDGVVLYNSKFAEYSGTTVSGDIFSTHLGNDNWLYLSEVCYSGKFESDYELYICQFVTDEVEGRYCMKAHPVCGTEAGEATDIYKSIQKMYSVVAEACGHVQFSDYVQSMIDNFLGLSMSSDQDEEDIPF